MDFDWLFFSICSFPNASINRHLSSNVWRHLNNVFTLDDSSYFVLFRQVSYDLFSIVKSRTVFSGNAGDRERSRKRTNPNIFVYIEIRVFIMVLKRMPICFSYKQIFRPKETLPRFTLTNIYKSEKSTRKKPCKEFVKILGRFLGEALSCKLFKILFKICDFLMFNRLTKYLKLCMITIFRIFFYYTIDNSPFIYFCFNHDR